MRARWIQRGLGALATAGALALGGCASSSIQTDAAAFVDEHAAVAARVARSARAVEAVVSQLSHPPSQAQLSGLDAAAGAARRSAVLASEWGVSRGGEGGEEGAEEEDLPRAQTEAGEAATDLVGAMSALETYVRAPSASVLARYRSELAHGREVWDESISQLWYLAHRRSPPTI